MKKMITIIILGLMLSILVSGCVKQNIDVLPEIKSDEDVADALGDIAERIDNITDSIEDVNEELS